MKNLLIILMTVIALTCTSLPAPIWAKSHVKTSKAPKARPATWAIPIKKPGLPNLYQITENLYRGAQPTREGFLELEKMGIKTVINFRTSTDSDFDKLQGTALQYESISFEAGNPKSEDVVRFLQIINDKKRQPFFIHCRHGADRTGMMSAIYRTTIQNWNKEEAVNEMVHGGYGFNTRFQNIIRYIRDLDVKSLKAMVKVKK